MCVDLKIKYIGKFKWTFFVKNKDVLWDLKIYIYRIKIFYIIGI